MLQHLKVPEWKWEEVGMDFNVGLPSTQKGYDSIWVIVDRLTKVDHFIPVKMTYTRPQLAEPYISRIVCLHEVPKKIVARTTPVLCQTRAGRPPHRLRDLIEVSRICLSVTSLHRSPPTPSRT
jgi:hypothetical protein